MCVCVCLCNVCAFASNIHADMIVCLLVYILSLRSIIVKESELHMCVCVVHVSLLCDD